jgi:hypothetical protein
MCRPALALRRWHFPILLLSLALPLCAGCDGEEHFRLVELRLADSAEGEASWVTLHLGWLEFSSGEEGEPAQLPLRGGDDLFLAWGWLPILRSDGELLEFGAEGNTVTLGGAPVALGLEAGGRWPWLEQATPEEKASLRVMYIDDENGIPPNGFSLLEDLAAQNPTLGLTLESTELLPRLLGLFDPGGLSIYETISEEHAALLTREPGLTRLQMEIGDLSDLSFLARIPNLERLFLGEWDPVDTGAFPDSLPSLRSLILSDAEIEDLEDLGHQPYLEELILWDCSGEEASGQLNIQALARHSELEMVSFRNCEVGDLSPLDGLDELRWLALSSGTTQEQLEQVVRSHPKLSFLEFTEAEAITDLNPLVELRKLRGLVVGSAAPPDPLFTLDRLEYLAVMVDDNDSEAYTPEVFARLRAELPETAVMQVEPFCLGSGFILLLVPLVGAAWCAVRRR